jgi:hypothetical protein
MATITPASRTDITCAFFWKMPRSSTIMTLMTRTKPAHSHVTGVTSIGSKF